MICKTCRFALSIRRMSAKERVCLPFRRRARTGRAPPQNRTRRPQERGVRSSLPYPESENPYKLWRARTLRVPELSSRHSSPWTFLILLWCSRESRGRDSLRFLPYRVCCMKKVRICGEAVAGSESFAEIQKQVRSALGRQVKDRRRALELTQADLAMRAGVRRAMVIELERGEANPRLDSLVRIAAALKIEPAELLSSDP
ncbi:DNA-binding XRE family transcriptional regulator [Bradyrhizobium sp. LB8.2]